MAAPRTKARATPAEQGESQSIAPLEPPSEPLVTPVEGESESAPIQAPLATEAAPLAAPVAPLTPPEPVGPPVHVQMIATPGSEFVDLLDEAGKPMDPERLFSDPGAQFGYVEVAELLVRSYHLPGTTRVTQQLWKPQGWRLDRAHAEKVKADLIAARAAREAAD